VLPTKFTKIGTQRNKVNLQYITIHSEHKPDRVHVYIRVADQTRFLFPGCMYKVESYLLNVCIKCSVPVTNSFLIKSGMCSLGSTESCEFVGSVFPVAKTRDFIIICIMNTSDMNRIQKQKNEILAFHTAPCTFISVSVRPKYKKYYFWGFCTVMGKQRCIHLLAHFSVVRRGNKCFFAIQNTYLLKVVQ